MVNNYFKTEFNYYLNYIGTDISEKLGLLLLLPVQRWDALKSWGKKLLRISLFLVHTHKKKDWTSKRKRIS